MKINIYKKITALIYITIFLFSLFVPFNQIFAQSTNVCPAGFSGTYPLCIGPAGTGLCPNGFSGTYPYCTASAGTCPNGFSGTYPLCIGLPGTGICPTGFSGTYPYCTGPTCPSSQVPAGVCPNTTSSPPVPLTPGATITCPPQKIPSPDGTGCVTPTTNTTYQPLAPLSDNLKTIDTQKSDSNPCPFGNYLNIMIKIIIGFGAVLAMVMIVIGGVEYMTDELISGKEAGKERIRNAIFGLLLALGAYLILNTINPQLLSACLDKLPTATIIILPYDPNTNSYTQKISGNCSVITSGDCSPSNFKNSNIFSGKEDNASKICNMESSGNATNKSMTDYCSTGQTTFSFGLFQINLLVHGGKIPSSVGNCTDLFTKSDGSPVTNGYVQKDANGKISYDCKLKPDRGDDYNKCVAYLKTAAGNLQVAQMIFNNAGNTFRDWQASDQNVCSSAFQ